MGSALSSTCLVTAIAAVVILSSYEYMQVQQIRAGEKGGSKFFKKTGGVDFFLFRGGGQNRPKVFFFFGAPQCA